MPIREYACENSHVFDFLERKKSDKPKRCPECGSGNLTKLFSTFGFSVRSSGQMRRIADHFNKESEMKQDLKENYGVENVSPIGARNLSEVHAEVKSTGSYVKDKMQENSEKQATARREKKKEWARGAMQRAPKRRLEMKERRAAEAAEKRKIRLS